MDRRIDDLLDKQEIYEVLVRYCRGIDRVDEDLVRSCYHPDAYDDHGMFQGPASEFAAYAVENLRTMERTMHCIHNVAIEVHGSSAGSEAYCVAYHRIASRSGGFADHLAGIRYVDAFERRQDGPWLIAKRTVVYEWTRVDPVGREWTMHPHYARGRRDREDHSYEVLRGVAAPVSDARSATGPLAGVTVVELAGLGPGPFCGMVFADLGAKVVRVDRVAGVPDGPPGEPPGDVLERGKRSIAVDLKRPEGIDVVLRLAEHADALIDPYRPGVTERLGIGPDACLARNPALVYGRMTGWGQDGPYADMAGHDIDYIATTGILHAIGRAGGPPVPPLNLVGDFGGGGMLLAVGLLAGVLEARASGRGQVIDAAMLDGAALLAAIFFGREPLGDWSDERGTNLLDSGAPFYDVYETADGRYVAVGAMEPHLYAELLARLGLDGDADLPDQYDRRRWPELRERLAAVFAERTRDEWCEALEGTDACFAPVLSFSEAPCDPHNRRREVFVEVDGTLQPAPAPRFARTPAVIGGPPPHPGEHTVEVLRDLDLAAGDIERLVAAAAVKATTSQSNEGVHT